MLIGRMWKACRYASKNHCMMKTEKNGTNLTITIKYGKDIITVKQTADNISTTPERVIEAVDKLIA